MKKTFLTTILLLGLFLTGCAKTAEVADIPLNRVDDKFNTYYEVFLYSFCDSNGDGIGDINGLISKLDYLNDGDDSTDTDLSIDGIWLMPIMPASTYHKYDVEDYKSIDEEYGTMEDFDRLVAECDARGIDVIIDLVINHSSNANPWFKTATAYIAECVVNGTTPNKEECKYFDYYNFSDKLLSGYKSLANGWYYEAQFDSRMPDMNLGCENLRREIEDIVDFWFAHGVSGFRLDAVKEFYSNNAVKNIETLDWFNSYVKSVKPDAYLVGECWTGEDTYLSYYNSGADSFFDFAGAQAEGYSVKAAKVKYKGFTAKDYAARCEAIQEKILAINPEAINAPFLSNHDNDRSAGYFSGEMAESQLKMAAALNLMEWGNAFIYYGEEIGMKGSGTDPNRRAPMYWELDVYGEGMCKGPSEMKGVTQKYRPVNEQLEDEQSILSFYKGLIKLRNQNPEIARGTVENLEDYSNGKTAVIKKTWDGSEILLLINISDEADSMDLSGITLNGHDVASSEIRGVLYAGTEEKNKVKIKKNKVTLPGFSLIIFK